MILSVTPEGGSPARQIHDQISGLITTGRLGRGERLPSVRQLAADLAVAPGTVAKAYRSLEADGLLVTRVGIDLAAIVGADGVAASSAGGEITGGVAIGSSLVLLLLFIANLLVSLVVMVLGIIAAVMGRGRARLGGVLVAVGIPVATILYWILSIVMGIVLAASGAVDASGELTASHFRLVYGVDIVRAVLMGAVILLGAFFVHSTAKKKLSA